MPIVAGTPALGRWCLFGHLFARSGTDGQVHRIDRHPIMSVHPVTPMDESDLVRHLGRQAALRIGSLGFDRWDAGSPAVQAQLQALRAQGVQAVVLDAAHEAHMAQVGELLCAESARRAPLFVVGSSGAEYALTRWWQQREGARAPPHEPRFDAVDRVLAVSGSASRLSSEQIAAAVQAGFAEIALDAAALTGPAGEPHAAQVLEAARGFLQAGRSVILHTARGPDDARIAAMLDALQATGLSALQARHQGGRLLGLRLGALVRQILRAVPLRRLLLSGGDTSSQVVKTLRPDALRIAARLAPGAPLCRLAGGEFDGLEVALKGGQLGTRDFFERARRGSA